MRIARAIVAASAVSAFAAFFSTPASANLIPTSSSAQIEERPTTSSVVQNVLTNVAVTVTVMSHPGEAIPGTGGLVQDGSQNLELSATSQLALNDALLFQEAVSVTVGAITSETPLDCGSARCNNVMVVLAQYN